MLHCTRIWFLLATVFTPSLGWERIISKTIFFFFLIRSLTWNANDKRWWESGRGVKKQRIFLASRGNVVDSPGPRTDGHPLSSTNRTQYNPHPGYSVSPTLCILIKTIKILLVSRYNPAFNLLPFSNREEKIFSAQHKTLRKYFSCETWNVSFFFFCS